VLAPRSGPPIEGVVTRPVRVVARSGATNVRILFPLPEAQTGLFNCAADG
jgi:hypothetical protein